MAWLYKQKGSENWWVGYRVGGVLRRQSLSTTDKEEAQKELDRIKAIDRARKSGLLTESVLAAMAEKALPRATLLEEIESWLSETKRSATENTHARYKPVGASLVRRLKATKDGPLITDVTTAQLRSHLEKRFDEASPATANLERKILRIFFKRAVDNKVLKENPMLAVKPFNVGKRRKKRPFTASELKTLFAKSNPFWQYMELGGFFTGLRLGDLVTLEIEDCDFKDDMIHRDTSKTLRHGRTVHIPIAPKFKEAILGQIGNRTSGPIWPAQAAIYRKRRASFFSKEFYDLMSECFPGICPKREDHSRRKSGRASKHDFSELTFHSLRHTFISMLKNTGASQAEAKELAGHSTDAINNVYTHLPKESLVKAIGRLEDFTK